MAGHTRLARYSAPAAFLLAATVAILLVRSGLSSEETTPVTRGTVTATTVVEPAGTTTAETTTGVAGAEFYVIEPGVLERDE